MNFHGRKCMYRATDKVVHGLGNVWVIWSQLCLVDLKSSLVVILHLRATQCETTTSQLTPETGQQQELQ